MNPINIASRAIWGCPVRVATFALAAIIATVGASRDAHAADQVGPCMQDAFTLKGGGTLNCSANDLTLARFSVASVIEPCTSVGDQWTFTGTVDLDPRSNFRYDLGFYISSDGIDALTGTCTVGIVNNTDVDNNGNSVNLDADVCGDFTKIANVVPISSVTTICTDDNSDGFFDLKICTAYDNNVGDVCGGITDAVPGGPSKCQCETIETTESVPQCANNSECASDGNPCTNEVCGGPNPDLFNCGTVNNTASCDDGLFCNGTDTCSGGTCSGHSGNPCTGGGICGSTCNEGTDTCFASASTVCRSAAGICDVAENCTGTSATCPANTFNSGNTCRSANGVCDVAETCSGLSSSCPTDGFASTSVTCRSSAGECDVAEVCSGSASCPADGFASGSTPCTDDGNLCTNDFCNGSGTCAHPNNSAPCDDGLFCNGDDTCSGGSCSAHDGDPCVGGGICGSSCNESTDDCFAAPSTVCRAANGVCDVAENCTGASGACPADGFSTGNTCRNANGICDVAETCSGGSASCPADGFASTTVTCRSAAGECDAAETCTGGAASCPADGQASNSTPCTDDGNVCTDDLCDGSGTCAHTNNTGPCDDGTFCNGPDTCLAGACTVHPGDPCASGFGVCSGTCNEASDACDGGDGNACDDGLFCNGTDTCDAGTCSLHTGDPCTGGSVCQDQCNETADSCNDPLGGPCTDDSNVCTDDECDGAGVCVHNNNSAPCDDGTYCNGPDTCAGGTCSTHGGDPCIGGGICGSTCNEGPETCFASGATVCRAVAGVCDVAENCTGASTACPADTFTTGNTCRGTAGVCDVAETCSGASASCPADGFASGSVVCRGAADVCDVAENCSGAASCPADGFANSSTPCASDSNVCTDDFCDGSGTCGHTNNTAPCSDGLFCTGVDVCASGTCTSPGDPCVGNPICADTCNEDADTCFSDSNTACTDDANTCTDDFCDGLGTCAHTNNNVPCDDGTFCNGPDFCDAGTCSSHFGDPCVGNPICSSVCNETANNCNDTDGIDCSDACTEGTCTDGQCEGTETLLSPTCRWIVIGGVGPVSEGNTVKTTGVRNDAGSLMDGSSCGYFSKRSRGITSGHFVVTAGIGQGVKGFGIKFSVGADVLGDIVTGGSGVRVGQVGEIPGTLIKTILYGQVVEKLDDDLQPTGSQIDTTSVHPLVDVCDEDQDKLADAVPLLDALTADVVGTKYRVRPGGLATIDATGMGTAVYSYTSVKISGRAAIRLVGGPTDVIIIKSEGDIKIGKGANITLFGGLTADNVLFYGKGRRCKTGRQVVGSGTWFCPAARRFQLGTGAAWTGTWLGGVKEVRLRRRAELTYTPFSGI